MRLLYATDGSACAMHAGRWVAALPWETQPEVDVVTVLPERVPYRGPAHSGLAPDWDLIEQVRDKEEAAARRLVEHGAEPFHGWTPAPRTWVRRGHAPMEILRQAQECQADWLLLGSRGVTATPRFPLGGVSLSTLKLANSSSILIVGPDTQPPRTLLVATDFSEHSERAVSAAAGLPLPRDARAVVLHVLQEHPLVRDLAAPLTEEVRSTLDALRQAQQETVKSLLRQSQERLSGHPWQTQIEVRDGDAAEQILAAAADHQADWIVLGARGLSPTLELALGSVSQKVALFHREALLVVR
jgi:nucleotide-binding universal stress UspA family protein